jgi:murein L,D-transpeptidase YcbB/YkuD
MRAVRGWRLALTIGMAMPGVAMPAAVLPSAAWAQSAAPASSLALPANAPSIPREGATAATTTAVIDAAKAAQPQHSHPMYGPQTLEHTRAALAFYEELAAAGGWPQLGPGIQGLKRGSIGALVERLKVRLIMSGDLAADMAAGDLFDGETEEALKRFQLRHGLSQTGSVGRLTTRALNVPVDVRLNQLRASIHRLEGNAFAFASRYVVVNIPGAQVEAVADGVVERRHVAIVGRPDRPSPVLATRITAVNLNPTWTVPMSIVKADIIPQMRKDPGFLAKNHMRLIGAGQAEIDPKTINWATLQNPHFYVRQDPGAHNSLGQLRIDMPNSQAVFLHDTPKKELFRNDVRFNSSGCARIDGVRELAAWLLKGTEWEAVAAIDAGIATGERKDIKLPRSVPIAWVYLTGWAAGDGLIHFRDDIYGLDTPEGLVTSTITRPKPAVKPAAAPKPATQYAPAAAPPMPPQRATPLAYTR